MLCDVSRCYNARDQNDHVKAALTYFTRSSGLAKDVIPSHRHLVLVCLAPELDFLEPFDESDDPDELDELDDPEEELEPSSDFELDSEPLDELPPDDSLEPPDSPDPLEPAPFPDALPAALLSLR